ncbi:MAG: type IV secretion system DNA-binding domain-containing protein [Parcubacteria group bacterium]|nr:type IV secretion system DNA-binding domain-containing protein [Parcubacteria group bacterium]
MNDNPDQINYFAATDSRGNYKPFGIKAEDRARHMYVIGKTGMGKSTLLENLAIQDIQNGNGLAFIDPHGSTAEKLLDYIPENRIKDVVYFAPFDMEYPIAFNVMEDVGYDKRHLVVSGLMGAFKKIWADQWSARMEYILSNALLALLEYPDSTLLDVNKMLINKAFRNKVVERITDPIVKSFWAEEFANYGDRYAQEATPAIQNKIGQFTSNPLVRNIVGQPKSTFDLRNMMDTKKIFIANLSKGRMGEQNADLVGSMLTTKLYLAAMSRADVSAKEMEKLPPFYFYVDEFQSVANESFADILSEARKYKLALTIAHQYVEQMEEEVRDAVFGNVGTTIIFRVGPLDAELFETLCQPKFTMEDLINLGSAQIYLMLMIDGVGSQPFSATTLPPIVAPEVTFTERIIENSRKVFGNPRKMVEDEIRERNAIEDSPQKRSERALREQENKAKTGGAPSSFTSKPSSGSFNGGRSGGSYSGASSVSRPQPSRPSSNASSFSGNRPQGGSPNSNGANRGGGASSTSNSGSSTGASSPRNELNRHEKTISLSELRSKMKDDDKNKEKGKKEQVSDLRSALKSAVENHKKEESKTKPKPEPKSESKVEKKDESSTDKAESSKREIPEAELRDILDVKKATQPDES